MFNIDNEHIEFSCPECGFYNIIFFKQARLREVVICRGCKSNIYLDDQMNECRKAKWVISKALQKLERSLKNISIKIKI